MTVIQIIPVNGDFTGNVYRLMGHFIFIINIFMKCFYIFKLFHREAFFCLLQKYTTINQQIIL